MIRALMIPVEKAVRPVVAQHTRKLRMREELYSLIEERYQSFLTAGCTEEDAQQKAIAAFGDPQSISDELRKTVPAWHRGGRQYDQYFFPGAPAPTVRQAISSGLCLMALMGTWLCGISLVLALVKPNYPAIAIGITFWTLATIFGLNTSLAHWLAGRTIKKFLSHDYGTAVLHACLFGLVFAISIASLDLSASVEFFLRSGWIRALAALPIGGGMYLFICWLASIEASQRQPWEALDLD